MNRNRTKRSWPRALRNLLKISFAVAALFLLLHIAQDLAHLTHGLAAIERVQHTQGATLHGISDNQATLQHQVADLRVRINGVEQAVHHVDPSHRQATTDAPVFHAIHLPHVAAVLGAAAAIGARVIAPVLP